MSSGIRNEGVNKVPQGTQYQTQHATGNEGAQGNLNSTQHAEQMFDQLWMDVTTHRAWRHTVGRISCLARIPIYGIAIALQTGKTVIKGIVSPFVSFGRWATGSEKLESWSFNGVARDTIMVGNLIDRTVNSALCVICAPPKQYRSFVEACSDYFSIVFMGSQHNETSKGVTTPGELFDMMVLARPQYHKQIIQCESIYNNEILLTYRLGSRIKAG